MNDALLALSGEALHAGYANAELSPVEVTEVMLAAADVAAERYAAVSALNRADATTAAAASLERWRAGTPIGPLDGVPVTLKDSFHVNGLPRWHGSACHVTTISEHDAAPVRRLREAGAVIIAKTTMPDFAMVMSGLSSRHGIITNPWDRATSPGGSSSGAGACLAAGVAPLGLGTDMVGSVRVPAALCGVTALCPTRGRIAYNPPATYRSAGPMARTVGDLISGMEAVGRTDPADHFALPGAFTRLTPREDLRGLRIGVMRDLGYGTPPTSETLAALDSQVAVLGGLGAEIEEIGPLPVDEDDYAAIVVLLIQKGALELHSVTPERRRLVQPQIAAMLEPVYALTTLTHGAIMARLDTAASRVSVFLDRWDYIVSPTIPAPAFAADQVSCDPEQGAMSMMAYVCWFNQIGAPAGSLPVLANPNGGPPLSVQVAGRRTDDAGVLDVMVMLEARRSVQINYPLIRTGETAHA